MTGVKAPTGVLGVGAVLGAHVSHGTLPFTGLALGTYLVLSSGLVGAGIVLRVVGRIRACK